MALLTAAMETEKERAEWEKHERRMQKLKKGGHSIKQYQANFEGETSVGSNTCLALKHVLLDQGYNRISINCLLCI